MMHTLGLVKVGGSADMMANDVLQKESSDNFTYNSKARAAPQVSSSLNKYRKNSKEEEERATAQNFWVVMGSFPQTIVE